MADAPEAAVFVSVCERAPITDADADFPKPYLVLRTLKGEIMVGLRPGQAEALAQQDPTWLINGKRGIIQMVR